MAKVFCYSGLFDTEADSPRIMDIAHQLSQINRFGGATKRPWSVAQHSLFVAALCPVELKLAGLLHDASEAYLGDIVRPLLATVGATYLDQHHVLQSRINDLYGVSESEFDRCLIYDNLALEYEIPWFINNHGTGKTAPTDLSFEMKGLEGYLPHQIRGIFLEAFYEYQKQTARLKTCQTRQGSPESNQT